MDKKITTTGRSFLFFFRNHGFEKRKPRGRNNTLSEFLKSFLRNNM